MTRIQPRDPIVNVPRQSDATHRKVLFVCSKNQWRSPTAEKIFSNPSVLQTRSAGTSRNARRRVTARDVEWADVILAMEKKHKQRLQSDFPVAMQHKEVYVLDITDDFPYMDPELVRELHAAVDPLMSRILR